VTDLLSPPLARWDGLHLALDLDRVERHVNELLSARQDLRDLSLKGEGDAVAAEVTVVYRGDEKAMRASPGEIQAARDEGIRFRLECAPINVLGDDTVTGVCFVDPSGGQASFPCDAVIFAVGQVCQPPDWLRRLGVESSARGIIQVDAHGRTSHVKIYAGGDNTLGPDLVVTAIAAGRRAAEGILDSFRPSRRAKEAVTAMFTSQQIPGNRIPVAATVIQQESVP